MFEVLTRTEIFLLNCYSCRLKPLFLNEWTVERTFDFWSMTWSNIPANLFWSINELTFPLNFWTDIPAECIWSMTWTVIHQWFELIDWLVWLLIDHWIDLVFPAAILVWFGCWLAQLFPSERLNFVILWHLFDFVTKGSPRMCFVTVVVLNFPCNCTLAFVAEFELFTSEALPLYMFPN